MSNFDASRIAAEREWIRGGQGRTMSVASQEELLDALEEARAAHKEAFGWCYQLAGAAQCSADMLDNLSALANGKDAPHPWKWPAGTGHRSDGEEDDLSIINPASPNHWSKGKVEPC